MFSDYPDLARGLNSNKVIDENKKTVYRAKIRKDRFNEIKELWNILNKKYFISYSKIEDSEIVQKLVDILKEGIEGNSEIVSYERTLKIDEGKAYLLQNASKQYEVDKEYILYNEFLNKVYNATNVPIKLLHLAFVEYNKYKNIGNEFFNNNTLINYINKINEWKIKCLSERFKYIASSIQPEKTALTDSTGNAVEYVTEGSLGIHYSDDKPSDKYLYDLCLYDSDMEKKNITLDNEEVVVYGKIPSKSIRIPIVNGASYSPDFMYVVKKTDGTKEIYLVIETKDYDSKNKIPTDQQFKIDCAKKFFKMIKEDGYVLEFKEQLNTTKISTLIKDL